MTVWNERNCSLQCVSEQASSGVFTMHGLLQSVAVCFEFWVFFANANGRYMQILCSEWFRFIHVVFVYHFMRSQLVVHVSSSL